VVAAEPPPAAEVPGAPFPEQRTPLDPSPDPALVVDGPNGPLPIIGEDGRQPWIVYARPFELPADTPRIAIVIGGLGLSRAGTQAAIQQLPGVVTLAFAPYAPDLGDWIAEARAAGHEVMLQLPMEPEGYPANDPGPHTLLTQVAAEDNLARLDWLLSRFTGYVGVTNYMGARFTVSPDDLRPVLEDLQMRGLLFFDSRENPDSVAAVVAAELEMPRVVNNRFLDTVASRISIDARLLELERIAEATGAAVGIGYPYPVTIERIAAWIRSLEGGNVVIAPISALASTQPVN
ncbi:MAG: divergent polysaccharide deacetylase family protein, partial [Proteobacteria bacterium]|nr:divergent polysaccharide deacetylase family protein [Pseudomonadota bacterium]